MPQDDYIPRPDDNFGVWIKNFAAKCEAYQTEVGFTKEQVQTIQSYAAQFKADLRNVQAAKINYESSVVGKDSTRKIATDFARSLARQVKGTPTLNNSDFVECGVVYSKPQYSLETVRGLKCVGYSDGINALKWKRGENAKGTIFLIEYRYSENSPWQFAYAVTRTDYRHSDQIPGRTVFYRVTAKRANKKSAPSPSVVVYPGYMVSEENIAA
jgi:hypothetical protein